MNEPASFPAVEPARVGVVRRVADVARLVHRAGRYRFRLNPAEVSAMFRLLNRGGVAIDVGAHKGAYSYFMARRVGQGGRVLAIEPQARLAPRTAATLRAAGLANVELVQAAASDRVGSVPMDYRESSTHGAALDGLAGSGVVRTTVQAVTLDALVQSRGLSKVDFIKIDVEGHEQAVLRGAMGVLRAHAPALLVEVEARHHAGAGARAGDGAGKVDPLSQVRAMLEPIGYAALAFVGCRCVRVDELRAGDVASGRVSNNFLFVRADRVSRAVTP